MLLFANHQSVSAHRRWLLPFRFLSPTGFAFRPLGLALRVENRRRHYLRKVETSELLDRFYRSALFRLKEATAWVHALTGSVVPSAASVPEIQDGLDSVVWRMHGVGLPCMLPVNPRRTEPRICKSDGYVARSTFLLKGPH